MTAEAAAREQAAREHMENVALTLEKNYTSYTTSNRMKQTINSNQKNLMDTKTDDASKENQSDRTHVRTYETAHHSIQTKQSVLDDLEMRKFQSFKSKNFHGHSNYSKMQQIL